MTTTKDRKILQLHLSISLTETRDLSLNEASEGSQYDLERIPRSTSGAAFSSEKHSRRDNEITF
jgi:hypothetical protein